MAKARTRARCTSCDHVEPRWVGRCPACGEWGTVEEEAVTPAAAGSTPTARPAARATPLHEVAAHADRRVASGLDELDRVLGGGLVPGSVVLLGGEPGAGKSTLLLQAADAIARSGSTVLYVSAEESAGQVRLRAERLGVLDGGVLLATHADLSAVTHVVEQHDPGVLIVDSIQTVRDPETTGVPGGVGQVRDCATALTRLAKERAMATVLVGHVTKEGALAGPRVLEHLVDAVCELEGDRHHALRLLRATKNRFGAVGEVGCFEMTGSGLTGVVDAGRLFVGDTHDDTAGVAVTLALEGHRPLASEVQALVTHTGAPNPRRAASGLDGQRVQLLAAVCQERAQVNLREHDLYASTVGGLRLAEPAVDLALCLAIASARHGGTVPRDLVALAEVGLAGELRLVTQTERRLAEAARLGFRRALVPSAYDGGAHGLTLVQEPDLGRAIAAVTTPRRSDVASPTPS
ncbi:DNA repair protein RadA [Egibacter rhizosphaerae]|uniref:DNA repair protein RadA n=1 Tax=Egibacter rhizosphaerae TaxID=1670831 RepID=A0A411YDL9_9ACTN|nr:DNA repair protein RadA [Egibacter rhizosphaerae]QBI19266.1 DNA repair protein RadA [Egibacter rhizosphaerae]